jgi:hypothetical protein
MKKMIGSIVALAGLAAAANAQQGSSFLEFQVSTDGTTWSSTVDAQPGQTVQIRARVSLLGATAMGLSGLNMQPVMSGWDGVGGGNAADTLLPFADTGSNTTTPPGGVIDAPGQYGRILPFAAPNVTTTNRLRGHLSGSTMRIAQTPTTNAIGAGSSSNNVNGSGGVPISQSTGFFAPPPGYAAGTENIVVFKIGVRVSDDVPAGSREIGVDAPIGGLSLYGPTGEQVRAVNWHAGFQASGSPLNNYAPVQVGQARIRVVPTPASLALLGLGGLVVGRRRR